MAYFYKNGWSYLNDILSAHLNYIVEGLQEDSTSCLPAAHNKVSSLNFFQIIIVGYYIQYLDLNFIYKYTKGSL